ncbi:ABC transporter [Streptomyces sp. NBC_00659]|uniref:ABC transporter n=1 Tax=Streptomyces sp. NBC_00659 TaxID=2903669 RepID=UPI002E326945|nr:ABC transporter [Streptomyces sp. NBC_00659]
MTEASTEGRTKPAGPPPTHVVARALVRPVWRGLPRWAVMTGAVLGLVLAGSSRTVSEEPDPWLCLNLLRAAALAFGLGLAFLFDDPARHTTATVPTRRPVRTGLRLVLVVPFMAVCWTAALFLIPVEGRPPMGAITLEAAAVMTLALTSGLIAVRHSGATEPGIAISAGLVGAFFAAAVLLPARWELFVGPSDPHWDDAHRRWAAVLVVVVLAGARSLGEPLRRRRTTVLARR